MNELITDSMVTLRDGRMHFLAAGAGSPVILLHSMASSVRSWADIIKTLAQTHSVYALDTMGQGDSDKPERDYSIADYADSVVEFMKIKGLGRASIVGCSVGATFAARIAAATPAVVDRLVLAGCVCRETKQEIDDGIAGSRKLYDRDYLPLMLNPEQAGMFYYHVNPEVLRLINDDRAKAGIWSWKCSTAMYSFDIAGALRKINKPTLILYGEKDFLRFKENAVKAYVKGADFAVIPSASHLVQVDNPEAFLKAVIPFLA